MEQINKSEFLNRLKNRMHINFDYKIDQIEFLEDIWEVVKEVILKQENNIKILKQELQDRYDYDLKEYNALAKNYKKQRQRIIELENIIKEYSNERENK